MKYKKGILIITTNIIGVFFMLISIMPSSKAQEKRNTTADTVSFGFDEEDIKAAIKETRKSSHSDYILKLKIDMAEVGTIIYLLRNNTFISKEKANDLAEKIYIQPNDTTINKLPKGSIALTKKSDPVQFVQVPPETKYTLRLNMAEVFAILYVLKYSEWPSDLYNKIVTQIYDTKINKIPGVNVPLKKTK
jgi:hypothetical protein